MRRMVVFFALSIGASSCSSCESCKGSSRAADAGPTVSEASSPPATSAPPAASAAKVEPNYACRKVARAITEKACECPQKNKMGCCYFGRPPFENGKLLAAPYVNCSGGQTDWPAAVESKLCEVGKDDKKSELLMACYAARGNLRCGKTAQGDVGVEVPPECETLLKEVQAAK
jgi:hypothetical protein